MSVVINCTLFYLAVGSSLLHLNIKRMFFEIHEYTDERLTDQRLSWLQMESAFEFATHGNKKRDIFRAN